MSVHFPLIEAEMPALETRLIETPEALALDAMGALDRAAQPGLYDRLDWLGLTHMHLWQGAPFVAASARQGIDALWLPLRDGGWGHGRGLASWYTLAFAPVTTPGCPPEARAALLGAVARDLRGRFGALTLWPLEPETADEIASAFRAHGWLALDRFEAAHWVAHTEGEDFEAYWARRASKLRNTVRRRTKKSQGVETQILDRFDDQAWSDYEAVYAHSWKPVEGSPALLRALAEHEGAAGTLRLGVARREGRPVAAQLWTVENGIATIHKLAHLESEREHSPGTLLSYAMFRHVLDRDRPAMIDYGNGDEPYKAEWMDERRVRHRLRLFDPRSASGLYAGAATAIRAGLRRFSR